MKVRVLLGHLGTQLLLKAIRFWAGRRLWISQEMIHFPGVSSFIRHSMHSIILGAPEKILRGGRRYSVPCITRGMV
jgi:hypothetical protein